MSDKKGEYLEKIYNAYTQGVFRFIYFKVSDYELAKDFTEDTFVRFWKLLNRGENIQNPKAIIYLIANGIVIDHYRRNKQKLLISMDMVDERLIAKDDDIEEQLDKKLQIDQVFEKLKELKTEYQNILTLYYIEELKVSEIAFMLNKKENAIRVFIHRALRALKEKYD